MGVRGTALTTSRRGKGRTDRCFSSSKSSGATDSTRERTAMSILYVLDPGAPCGRHYFLFACAPLPIIVPHHSHEKHRQQMRVTTDRIAFAARSGRLQSVLPEFGLQAEPQRRLALSLSHAARRTAVRPDLPNL